MERPMRARPWIEPDTSMDRRDADMSVESIGDYGPRFDARAKRPLSTFVAQLIAMDQRLPQARFHRRAEPEEAIAAYAAASGRSKTGRRLRQSV